MSTNVHLSPDLEQFAQASVRSGRYNNVSEVVRAALRLLQDADARRTAFVASLEAAVTEGDRDGFLGGEAAAERLGAAIDAAASQAG